MSFSDLTTLLAEFLDGVIFGDTAGKVWTANGTGVLPTWQAPTGGSGSPASPDTSVQFNDGGSFGGDAAFTWDNTDKSLNIGAAPTATGGTVRFSDAVQFSSYRSVSSPSAVFISIPADNPAEILIGNASDYNLTLSATEFLYLVGPTTSVDLDDSENGAMTVDGNISISIGNTYKSSDGSSGIDTTITTGSLAGKTITVKNGLITGFA